MLADYLFEKMVEWGVTQAAMSKHLGLHPTQLNRLLYKKNKRPLKPPVKQSIANGLGITLEELDKIMEEDKSVTNDDIMEDESTDIKEASCIDLLSIAQNEDPEITLASIIEAMNASDLIKKVENRGEGQENLQHDFIARYPRTSRIYYAECGKQIKVVGSWSFITIKPKSNMGVKLSIHEIASPTIPSSCDILLRFNISSTYNDSEMILKALYSFLQEIKQMLRNGFRILHLYTYIENVMDIPTVDSLGFHQIREDVSGNNPIFLYALEFPNEFKCLNDKIANLMEEIKMFY